MPSDKPRTRQRRMSSDLPYFSEKKVRKTPSRELSKQQTPPQSRQLQFETTHVPFSVLWRKILKQFTSASTGSPSDGLGGDGSESSASVVQFLANQRAQENERAEDDWIVDEVVVTKDEANQRLHGSTSDRGTTTGLNSDSHSDTHAGEKNASGAGDSNQTRSGFSGLMLDTIWPALRYYFAPKFEDKEREEEYQKLAYYNAKPLLFWGTLYLFINWVLYLILNHSETAYEHWTYEAGLSIVTFPLLPFIGFNMPKKHYHFFQIWFCIAVFYCGWTEIIQIKQCHFYTGQGRFSCNGKDFLAMLYYNTGFPALLMLIYGSRLYFGIAQIVSIILIGVFIIPDQGIFSRNLVSLIIFSIFCQYLNFSREITERRMFALNSQLKIAYRSMQKSQIAEAKASQAKRRFTAYLFHEVRVPLNTAWLAFQNLLEDQAFKEDALQQQSVEVYALEASLSMMQQVLNDALDHQRMDAGRFECFPKPFGLQRSIAAMLGPVNSATTAKKLNLVKDFDPLVDQLPQAGQTKGSRNPNPEGLWVIGDEVRLRQVVSNLCSNAVKFSSEGKGDIKVVTRLVEHTPARIPEAHEDTIIHMNPTGPDETLRDEDYTPESTAPTMTVRIEIHDCGPGVKPSEVVSLFKPFTQTTVGKSSGKGSGLGLSITRSIVTLSGGKMGVKSRKGEGACFWFELTYPIATQAQIEEARLAAPSVPEPVSNAMHRPSIAMSSEQHNKYPSYAASYDSDDSVGPTMNAYPSPQAVIDAARERLTPGLHTANMAQPILHLIPPADPVRPPIAQGRSDLSSLLTQPSPALPENASSSSRTPLIPPASPASSASIMSGGVSPMHTEEPLRVLVVDDDGMTRILMSRMLTKLGCQIDTANDGQQAIDILIGQNKRYDLVTLDNSMPVMTGEEVIRNLRQAGRRDFVAGATGNANTEDQASYLDAGVDRVLTKPISLVDLKSLLLLAAERRRSPFKLPDSLPPLPPKVKDYSQ